eukprot:GHVT01078959.1.p2 GENE.GHVT01078959.1~~GHVT01078959.1.p2  ORF type:complete len:126 (+),score=16.83 GHVT01078959.1:197-574(+)
MHLSFFSLETVKHTSGSCYYGFQFVMSASTNEALFLKGEVHADFRVCLLVGVWASLPRQGRYAAISPAVAAAHLKLPGAGTDALATLMSATCDAAVPHDCLELATLAIISSGVPWDEKRRSPQLT